MLAKILLLLGCAAGLYALVFGLRRPKAPQWAAGQRATWLLAAFCAACWLAGRARARLGIAATRGLLLDLLLTGETQVLDEAAELLGGLLTRPTSPAPTSPAPTSPATPRSAATR